MQLDKVSASVMRLKNTGPRTMDALSNVRSMVITILQTQVTDAVRIVTQALSAPGATNRHLYPALVASIQLQLHQIFLFAVTSSAGGGPDMNALQEICGLVQVVGVISGMQIGPTADANTPPAPQQSQNSSVLSPVQLPDATTSTLCSANR